MDIVEYQFNNKTYIDLAQLVPLRPYASGCASIPQLIAKKKYEDIINGKVVNGALVHTERRSRKFGSVYVNKHEVLTLFDKNNTCIDPPAPPIIDLDDLVFFKDKCGVEHKVLMRGERSAEGIFFRIDDVIRTFQMPRLDNNIQKEHTSYQFNKDYKWFNLSAEYSVLGKQHRTRELYLTYDGIMKVIPSL